MAQNSILMTLVVQNKKVAYINETLKVHPLLTGVGLATLAHRNHYEKIINFFNSQS